MTIGYRGHYGEALAKDYLLCRGFSICAENVHSRFGEIDIVAQKGGILYFFEVKQRKQGAYLPARESIPISKITKVVKTVQLYLLDKGWEDREYRLSALCIDEYIQGHPRIAIFHDIAEM